MIEMYTKSVIRGQLVRKWRTDSEDEWTNIHDDDDDDDYNNNNNNDCADPDVRDGRNRSRDVADYTITRK